MNKAIYTLRIELAKAQAAYVKSAADLLHVETAYYGPDNEIYDFGDVCFYEAQFREAWQAWKNADARLRAAVALRKATREAGYPMTAPLGQVARITRWTSA